MRIIVTRPQPDATTSAERLRKLGHKPVLAPLLTIVPLPRNDLGSAPVQAVLVTSANALRTLHRHEMSAGLLATRLFAVGPASAALARQLGFSNVRQADGSLAHLVELARRELDPHGQPLAYLCGRRRSGDLAGELRDSGFRVKRVELYDAIPADQLPPDVADCICTRSCDAVVLYSVRTAKTWCRLAGSTGLVDNARMLVHFCLSNAVASVIAEDMHAGVQTVVAGSPDEPALMHAIELANEHGRNKGDRP